MTMEELISIGLPKLSEGLFYRVETDFWGTIFLEIRKDRRVGSKLLAREHTCRWNQETASETILRLHKKMIDDGSFYAERQKYWVSMASLEGDHR